MNELSDEEMKNVEGGASKAYKITLKKDYRFYPDDCIEKGTDGIYKLKVGKVATILPKGKIISLKFGNKTIMLKYSVNGMHRQGEVVHCWYEGKKGYVTTTLQNIATSGDDDVVVWF